MRQFADTKNHSFQIGTLRDLLPYLWPKENPSLRLRILAALGCLILSKVAVTGVPYFYKLAVDALTMAAPIKAPVFFILAYGLTSISSKLFTELKEILFARVGQYAVRQSALNVFQHLHKLSLAFHLNRETGMISRAIERGTQAIETILKFSTFTILPTCFEIFFVCTILFYLYDIWFGLIVVATLTLYITYTLLITQWRARLMREMNQLDSQANSKAIDSLLNYETVKYFTNEAYESHNYDINLARYETIAIKNKQSLSVLNIGQGIIIAVGLMGILLLAAQGVVDGTMTVGDFTLVSVYLNQLYIPLNLLGFAYRECKFALINMEQMYQLLYETPEVIDKPKAQVLQVKKGTVSFEKVNFGYRRDRQILHNVSFTIPAGKTVAVVGTTGAGKSTLSRLLYRFYDPWSGAITIDGQDIANVTQHSLRQAIGIVPQDCVLFNSSIAYNIAYGNPAASQEDIEKVAKLAEIHEFIISLPEGYNTLVGERGLKLSGGEKQRIAIARTLLKQPQIFIFDEATSALDTRTEKAIQYSLQQLSAHYTTLIIAHRLSTVVQAHRILVMEQGAIIEHGTHHELLAKRGSYAKLWQQQREKTE